MFDLNLLAKPGLQGENNNDKVSFIEDYSKTLNKTDKQFQSKTPKQGIQANQKPQNKHKQTHYKCIFIAKKIRAARMGFSAFLEREFGFCA